MWLLDIHADKALIPIKMNKSTKEKIVTQNPFSVYKVYCMFYMMYVALCV